MDGKNIWHSSLKVTATTTYQLSQALLSNTYNLYSAISDYVYSLQKFHGTDSKA
jgi:hypothetical protein